MFFERAIYIKCQQMSHTVKFSDFLKIEFFTLGTSMVRNRVFIFILVTLLSKENLI
jgi:hypothetical protein